MGASESIVSISQQPPKCGCCVKVRSSGRVAASGGTQRGEAARAEAGLPQQDSAGSSGAGH